jgi:hypothetical protein
MGRFCRRVSWETIDGVWATSILDKDFVRAAQLTMKHEECDPRLDTSDECRAWHGSVSIAGDASRRYRY